MTFREQAQNAEDRILAFRDDSSGHHFSMKADFDYFPLIRWMTVTIAANETA